MLVSKTPADARDDMIHGESGVCNVGLPANRPTYEPSKRLLSWPNGSTARVRSGADPDGLRGANTNWVWSDELAAWDYPRESWDQCTLTCRVGESPQLLITTTPKPISVLKEILSNERTVVSRGSTYENTDNLAPEFLADVLARYEGTTLGQQEIYAALLEEVEGALWTRKLINDTRVASVRVSPGRTVVAIDPAISTKQESNETGIVVAMKARNGHYYVLQDATARRTPKAWAETAIALYDEHGADRIIAEVNQGGDMFKQIHATKGKRTRAEPIVALFEQDRAHLVGTHPELEDQLCTWVPDSGADSPDRLDAMVWALTELVDKPSVLVGLGGEQKANTWAIQ
jgi:phage terminase large subunit-like protein